MFNALIRFCVAVMLSLLSVAARADDAPKPEAKVSADAQALLDKVSAAYSKLTAIELAGEITRSAEEAGNPQTRVNRFSSAFQAPNRFRHEIKDQPVFGSTGSKVYGYSAFSNLFVQADAPAGRMMLHDLPADHIKVLPLQNLSLVLALSKDPAAELKELASEITLASPQNIDGAEFAALLLKLNETGSHMTLLIDPQTQLIRRVVVDMKPIFDRIGRSDVASALLTVDYMTVKPNGAMTADQFAWAPPQGAKDIVAARAEALAAAESDGEPASALVGKPAPDFTLEGLDGKPITLSDLKGSVVVLDFWATWCGPCVASLPHLDRVYQDNLKAGLKVYALNQREARERVQGFVDDKHMTIPVLMDAQAEVAKQYYVNGIPQTVIVGKDGVVKKVIVGFNPNGDEAFRQVIAEELKAKPDAKPAARRPAGPVN